MPWEVFKSTKLKPQSISTTGDALTGASSCAFGAILWENPPNEIYLSGKD